MASRLLIVEDDDGIRQSLRLVMQAAGFEVVDVGSAEDALVACRDRQMDLMLVDLMLGGMDGFTFIRRVREFSQAPIVVISARDQTVDVVSALEAGADDYVSKPFVVDEVLARARALLRRPSFADAGVDGDTLVLDGESGLVLDSGAGTVRVGDVEVHLTSTEFRLLSVLGENRGRVMGRRLLLEKVWSHDFFGDERIVDVHIRRLRRKVEREPSDPRIVVTVRGLGYRLDPQ